MVPPAGFALKVLGTNRAAEIAVQANRNKNDRQFMCVETRINGRSLRYMKVSFRAKSEAIRPAGAEFSKHKTTCTVYGAALRNP